MYRLSTRHPIFDTFDHVGWNIAHEVAIQSRCQMTNEPCRFEVTGLLDGRKVRRIAHNWAGVTLASGILRRKGGEGITYVRLG